VVFLRNQCGRRGRRPLLASDGMRDGSRVLRGAAVALVGVALLVGSVGPARAQHVSGPCDLHRWKDEGIRHYSKRHIRCAVRSFGPVRGGSGRAICIAKRESGLIPYASSLTGKYLGLFQHAARYWEDRYTSWTKRRWELPDKAVSGRTNAVVTVRMVHAAGGWRKAGWPRSGC
jgi:hypothetical protein